MIRQQESYLLDSMTKSRFIWRIGKCCQLTQQQMITATIMASAIVRLNLSISWTRTKLNSLWKQTFNWIFEANAMQFIPSNDEDISNWVCCVLFELECWRKLSQLTSVRYLLLFLLLSYWNRNSMKRNDVGELIWLFTIYNFQNSRRAISCYSLIGERK